MLDTNKVHRKPVDHVPNFMKGLKVNQQVKFELQEKKKREQQE